MVSIVTNCTPVLPTAFTPNSDGRNDRLIPFLIGAKGLKRFTIYNRYGNIVFSTLKEGEGWDGRYKGTFLPTAVFVWVIEYTGNDDQVILEKGTVTLIR
jgi:gliding motility-associated-like protein